MMFCPGAPVPCQDIITCVARCAYDEKCLGIGFGPGSCNFITTVQQQSGCYFQCDPQMCDDRYQPCANGATCVVPPNNTDPKSGACRNPTCICPPGFTGSTCQYQPATSPGSTKVGYVGQNTDSGLRSSNIVSPTDNVEPYDSALVKCSERGWRLLELRSQEDSRELSENRPNYPFWIGLSRVTGTWLWASDGKPPQYTDWDEDDDPGDPRGLYAYVSPDRHDAEWHVALRDQDPRRLHILCEKGSRNP